MNRYDISVAHKSLRILIVQKMSCRVNEVYTLLLINISFLLTPLLIVLVVTFPSVLGTEEKKTSSSPS